jgi:hypothetical protein
MNQHTSLPIFLLGVAIWIFVTIIFSALYDGKKSFIKIVIFWVFLLAFFVIPFSPIQLILEFLTNHELWIYLSFFLFIYFILLPFVFLRIILKK